MSDEERPEDGADAKPMPRKRPPDVPVTEVPVTEVPAPDAEPRDSGAFFTDEEHDGWAPIRRRPAEPEET